MRDLPPKTCGCGRRRDRKHAHDTKDQRARIKFLKKEIRRLVARMKIVSRIDVKEEIAIRNQIRELLNEKTYLEALQE